MNWSDVSGYFDSDLVYKMAVKSAQDDAVFVEIGTWKGRSTSCMGQLIKESKKNIKFYAIDTFEGSEEGWHQSEINDLKNNGTTLFNEYENNLKLCNVYDIVNTIQSSSIEAASKFEDASIDFIFIDASHDYENVLADIQAWYPKVKPGGLICGDDYAPCWSGVRKAVDEYFSDKILFFLNGNLNYPYSQKVWHWCHKKTNTQKETDMKVTLYAIAKNEEKNLERFLKNAKKFDEVVVVDTGSTDNTVQLLKDAGIAVHEHPQSREEFDFALARNTALSYVTTDWAFSLDFNEDVDEFISGGLDPIESEFTVFKHLRFDDNGEDEPTQSFEVHNRFHRTANYKWVNAVHEMPEFVPTEEHPEESSVDTTIKITKRLQKSLDKELFYLSICERENKKDPTNEFYIWFIFNHYFSVNNFQKALEFGQEYLNYSKPYFNSFRCEVFMRCSMILLQMQEIQGAVNYSFHALSEAMNMGGELLMRCFAHLLNVGVMLQEPNIITFASSVSEEFKNLPERKDAITKLFNEIKE